MLLALHIVGSFVFTKETAQRLRGSFADDFQRILFNKEVSTCRQSEKLIWKKTEYAFYSTFGSRDSIYGCL